MEWVIFIGLAIVGLYYAGKMSNQSEFTDLKENLSRCIENNKLLNNEKYKIRLKNERLEKIIKSTSPFVDVPSLLADIELKVFDEGIRSLINRGRPALKAADEVRIIREKSREYRIKYREMLYKYEFLLKSFPELEKYVDDDEALKNISKCISYSEFEENTDRTSAFLSKEEWLNMSIDDRNQLALNRYKEREKSNWVIGIEYEMYIDHLLRSCGFSTLHYGIKEGLNDLGRDVIAKKKGKYYVIQCKNWSHKKEIHENVICQLFGTTLEYKIERSEKMPDLDWDKRVFPVLYTTTKLSNTAMKFAEKLGVQVIIKEKGEYPMIKCNIGKNGEKIYHLPYDQQYYKVIIEEDKGEFYAWTVKEAVDAGFRRAYKYNAINK